jgi:transcriptional regulator GlxA family with amidase domain
MTRHEIIVALDQEIQRLETARTLIRNSRNVAAEIAVENGYRKPVRRRISPEGRRRIVEAQRRRWAKLKREGAAKA